MRVPFFRWRDEAEPIGQGLNIYPLSSPYHFGGYLVIGRLRLYARYSKTKRRWFRRVAWVKPGNLTLPANHWARS